MLPAPSSMKIKGDVKMPRLLVVWVGLAPIAGVLGCARVSAGSAAPDPLPSWRDGPAKRAILDLVKATTDGSGPGFVPVEDRIATFDQDVAFESAATSGKSPAEREARP
jgi:hypothetical protein